MTASIALFIALSSCNSGSVCRRNKGAGCGGSSGSTQQPTTGAARFTLWHPFKQSHSRQGSCGFLHRCDAAANPCRNRGEIIDAIAALPNGSCCGIQPVDNKMITVIHQRLVARKGDAQSLPPCQWSEIMRTSFVPNHIVPQCRSASKGESGLFQARLSRPWRASSEKDEFCMALPEEPKNPSFRPGSGTGTHRQRNPSVR